MNILLKTRLPLTESLFDTQVKTDSWYTNFKILLITELIMYSINSTEYLRSLNDDIQSMGQNCEGVLCFLNLLFINWKYT